MRRLMLMICLFLVCNSLIGQDECKMCGDWIGTYTIPVPDPDPKGGFVDQNMKMFVRIKQFGDDISVRVKTSPVNAPNDIKYWPDCEITNATNNSISFASPVCDSYDWDNNDRKNGRVIYKASYSCICTHCCPLKNQNSSLKLL